MSSLLCQRIFHNLKCISPVTHQRICHKVRLFSVVVSNSELKAEDNSSFTVSYLINSCGLSLENAVKASKRINLQTPERPDSVLDLLKSWEFSDAHISKLVKNYPKVLLANPEKTLLPKLEFCRSIGFSSVDIGKIVCTRSELLTHSLNNNIIPCYDLLKSIVGNEESAASAFKLSLRIPRQRMYQNLMQNISVLKNVGMPQLSIIYLLKRHVWLLCVAHDKFCRTVDEAIEMGLDPSKRVFGEGMKVVYEMGIPGLERKIEFYGRFGWSKKETLYAFRCQPGFIALTEERIITMMNFFEKMGWPSKFLARYPVALCLSLEKRIVPRCMVAQVLASKGLLKELRITSLLKSTEKDFLQKYVTKFEESLPQLMDIYERKKNPCNVAIFPEEIVLEK